MSITTAPLARRIAAVSLAAALASPLAAFRPTPAPHRPPTEHAADLRSVYFGAFKGVSPNGRDLIWRGAIAGPARGELTILLAPVSDSIDVRSASARSGSWAVEGIVFVAGAPEQSFAADVRGTLDWKAGRVRLEGAVSEGYLEGAAVVQDGEMIDRHLQGDFRLVPMVATR